MYKLLFYKYDKTLIKVGTRTATGGGNWLALPGTNRDTLTRPSRNIQPCHNTFASGDTGMWFSKYSKWINHKITTHLEDSHPVVESVKEDDENGHSGICNFKCEWDSG